MNTSATPAIAEPSRFDRAMEITTEVLEDWKAVHAPGLESDDLRLMMVRRVNSWIAPVSVVAGVTDIMAGARYNGAGLGKTKIEQLGNELAGRLNEAGLLAASPRRSGLLNK